MPGRPSCRAIRLRTCRSCRRSSSDWWIARARRRASGERRLSVNVRRLIPLSLGAAALVAASLSAQAPAPDIAFDAQADFLKMPADIHLGEAAGVATNSRGHLFVYTRTGNPTAMLGASRIITHGGSRLFEFDQNGNYVREIGQGIYGFLQAHAVRVDAQDNIW